MSNEEAQLEQEADEKVQSNELIRKTAMANVPHYSSQDWFNKLDDAEVSEIGRVSQGL